MDRVFFMVTIQDHAVLAAAAAHLLDFNLPSGIEMEKMTLSHSV